MKAISRRLGRLEKEWGHALEAERRKAERSNPSPAQWIAKKLDEFGFVRDPKESLIESLARALGLSVLQVRQFLLRRAAGLE